MALTTATTGDVHNRASWRQLDRPGWRPDRQPLRQAGGPLCVRHLVPGYRGTQRCPREYPSTAASLLFFPDY
jgi:hypothetical protein